MDWATIAFESLTSWRRRGEVVDCGPWGAPKTGPDLDGAVSDTRDLSLDVAYFSRRSSLKRVCQKYVRVLFTYV